MYANGEEGRCLRRLAIRPQCRVTHYSTRAGLCLDSSLLIGNDTTGATLQITLVISVALHISSTGVDDELFLVQVVEGEPEDDCQYRSGDSRTSKGPDQVRVLDGRRSSQTNGSGNGSHEQVDGSDETLHVLWGSRVGNTISRDVDEDFGNGRDNDGDGVKRV